MPPHFRGPAHSVHRQRYGAGKTGPIGPRAYTGSATMDRRSFLTVTGLGTASLMIPISVRLIAAEQLLSTLDPAVKKVRADGALEAATAASRVLRDRKSTRLNSSH